ncbi:hypothetical protein X942_1402 [Burkholderia pseudomallei MSHR5596]|nr:hypothetical protein X942_1402 [Burkholderia pseudomallei MSHR5596]
MLVWLACIVAMTFAHTPTEVTAQETRSGNAPSASSPRSRRRHRLDHPRIDLKLHAKLLRIPVGDLDNGGVN